MVKVMSNKMTVRYDLLKNKINPFILNSFSEHTLTWKHGVKLFFFQIQNP